MERVGSAIPALLRGVQEALGSGALAGLSLMLVRAFAGFVIRVKGASMRPTLAGGEMLFYTAFDVRFGKVRRGDVVLCRFPGRGLTCFVKRVVAVPGDTLYRLDGATHVVYERDGESVDEPLDAGTGYAMRRRRHDYEPCVLGEEEYFVAGDNRGNSHDSRDWRIGDGRNAVGPVRRGMIVGHVRAVVWPFNKIRSVR